jgi:chemotaxis protein MotB
MARKAHAHHGGAWKVAYADFVTAMMALFMVLWLTSQDQKIKEAIERSFKNPFSTLTKEATGIIPNKEQLAVASQKGSFDSASAVELNMLRRLNQDLMNVMKSSDPGDQSVKLDLTSEGLLINIFDRARKPIFEDDSTQFTTSGDWVFSTLAWQISRYDQFTVELEGHTEKPATNSPAKIDSWQLTSARANEARKHIVMHGVKPGQIRKVAGYADTQPLPKHPTESVVNRRVSVMLKLKSRN